MKKVLLFLALAMLIFPLSACNNSKPSNADKADTSVKEAGLNKKTISQNRVAWQKKTSGLKSVYKDGYSGDYIGVAFNMKELLNQASNDKNYAVVEGTICNLESMKGPKGVPLTKTTIYVDKVISGKKSLNRKVIQVPLKGGIISTDDYYLDATTNKTKQNLLVQEKLAPLPKIGAQVIIRLTKVDFSEKNSFNNYLEKAHFSTQKSYQPMLEQFNYWIKNPSAKEFVLANSLYENQQEISEEYRAAQFQKLTDQLNEKFNK